MGVAVGVVVGLGAAGAVGFIGAVAIHSLQTSSQNLNKSKNFVYFCSNEILLTINVNINITST